MLNTLYIDTTNSCECTLVSSVDDKTARLKLNITSDIALNPQLEIVGGRTVDLYKSEMTVFFTDAEIQGTGTLQFRIVDDNHTGDYFNIKQCNTLDSTLYIKQIDNFNYELVRKTASTTGGVTHAELDEAKNEVLQLANEYADTVGNGKAELNHNHDERYYTETEVNNLLATKQDLVSKVKIYENSEGGNIRIFSPNGYYTEMDMHNDKTFRMYHVDSEGTYSGHVTKSYNSRVNLDVLSGVSTNVQTQLDSKQATLAITNGKGTRNTTYTTNGELTWRRYGQLVIVDIYDLNVPAITVGDESTNILFTGLPKAKHYSTTNLTPFNSAYGGLRVGIKGGDTKIVIWWQTKSGVALGYSGQLIYLAE